MGAGVTAIAERALCLTLAGSDPCLKQLRRRPATARRLGEGGAGRPIMARRLGRREEPRNRLAVKDKQTVGTCVGIVG